MLNIYKTRHGQLAHFKHDTTIRRALEEYGEWAEAEIYLISRFLQRGDTILDIGANIGTHSLAFARVVGPQGHVISMDAQHRIYQVLGMNMIMNEVPAVDCLNVLVGADIGVEMIPVTATSEIINFGAVSFQSRGFDLKGGLRHLPVAMITVDFLCVDRCDAMKVDVEGMEIDVFRGAVKTIQRCQPVIYFEQTSQKNLALILDLFTELAYDLYWHVANPYNARNFNGNPRNIFGGTCEVNIVAIPRARAALAEQLDLMGGQITNSTYNPLPPQNAIAGWVLPDNAYSDLEPVKSREDE